MTTITPDKIASSPDNAPAGFFNGATELARFLVEQGTTMEKLANRMDDTRELNGILYYRNRESFGPTWKPFPKVAEEKTIYPQSINIFTLDGMVDFINAVELKPGTILHVEDERTVTLRSTPDPDTGDRHVLATCSAQTPRHNFGEYMDTDAFNTWLLSRFIQNAATESVFALVKSMTKEQSLTTTDDGVSQAITVKQGTTCSTCLFKNPVPLQPIRTFSDITQPTSNYVLRVNTDGQVALFEGDGGAWKTEAVEAIHTHLRFSIKNDNVLVIA